MSGYMTNREYARSAEVIRLEAELERLKYQRNKATEAAREVIQQANAEFDSEAIPIMRRLAILRPAVDRTQTRTRTRQPQPVQLTIDDEWSDEDAAHFRELAARKRNA
jgi:hypothetical protein